MTTPKSKWKSKYKNLDRAAAKASLKKRENGSNVYKSSLCTIFLNPSPIPLALGLQRQGYLSFFGLGARYVLGYGGYDG